MHEYDVALKNILTRPGSSVLNQLTGASSLKWLNVEAPKVNNRRVDLLGELPTGVWFTSSCSRGTRRISRCGWPSTCSESDGNTAGCRGRLSCTSAKRRCA